MLLSSGSTPPATLQSSMPTVTAILVNWNNWQDTAACLESLAAQTAALEVIVVDNASSNDSVAQLRRLGANVLEAGANLGFAKACNLGAKQSSADYLWFLNNDTIAPPDTLTHLLDTPADLVGAELRYFDRPDEVQAWGGGTVSRWTGYSRHFLAPEPLTPDSYLTFACVLLKRTYFFHLGGLYEGAFMYFEDSDFCLCARAAGATLAVAPGTRILHKEGGSQAGRSAGQSPRMSRIFTTSGLHFMRRHCPVPPVGMLLFLGSRIARRTLKLRFRELPPIVAGALDYLRHPNRDESPDTSKG